MRGPIARIARCVDRFGPFRLPNIEHAERHRNDVRGLRILLGPEEHEQLMRPSAGLERRQDAVGTNAGFRCRGDVEIAGQWVESFAGLLAVRRWVTDVRHSELKDGRRRGCSCSPVPVPREPLRSLSLALTSTANGTRRFARKPRICSNYPRKGPKGGLILWHGP
jgi:hypothetical protein